MSSSLSFATTSRDEGLAAPDGYERNRAQDRDKEEHEAPFIWRRSENRRAGEARLSPASASASAEMAHMQHVMCVCTISSNGIGAELINNFSTTTLSLTGASFGACLDLASNVTPSSAAGGGSGGVALNTSTVTTNTTTPSPSTSTPQTIHNPIDEAFLKSHLFSDPTQLNRYDALAIVYTLALFIGYWLYFKVRFVNDPHGSLPSHFAFQRVMWPKHIWGNSTLKILTIQNVRSALMVVAALIHAGVVAIAALSKQTFRPWGGDGGDATSLVAFTQIRSIVPSAILIFSVFHLSIATWAFLSILFLSNCETLTHDTLEAILKVEGIIHNGERSYAAVTALSVQCQDHFRIGWRTLVVGLVTLLWAQSPVVYIVGASLLVFSLYHNDFFVWSQTMDDEISSMPQVCLDEVTARRLQWQQEVFGSGT